MMRLFRKKESKITLSPINECVSRLETVTNEIQVNIAEIESQLRSYRGQMMTMGECLSKNKMKAKAVRLLKRKKRYENQLERLRNHLFLIKQVNIVTQNIIERNVQPNIKKEDFVAAPQLKNNNFISEKLRLLCKKVIERSK